MPECTIRRSIQRHRGMLISAAGERERSRIATLLADEQAKLNVATERHPRTATAERARQVRDLHDDDPGGRITESTAFQHPKASRRNLPNTMPCS